MNHIVAFSGSWVTQKEKSQRREGEKEYKEYENESDGIMMEVSCEKLHKNLVMSLWLSLSLRTLGTRRFSTLGQSSIFYQKNQTKGSSPKLLCFTYSSSINMHTIKDHSETQEKHHLRWKMFTKKEIRLVPIVRQLWQ